ncbi:DNA topoisomerase I [Salinibaculum rarum]|uniref:DNA topoisomerase I n=1 Tax=Salinibaculum rarum TaxID=3058903 RepID=UPI00265F7F28|nr:DNA topoisomerase I [Salinibaculum sp. KK48]
MELIISEKHNAAKRIAEILSAGNLSSTRVNGVTVYEWGEKRCMGLAGHVVEVDFPDEYNDWNAVSPATLLDADITKYPSKPDIVSALNDQATDADRVVIATDYDREGELIGKEAYDLVKDVAQNVPIDRVRFSSLTGPEVTDAFQNRDTIDFNLAAAGEARQTIDLVWGASLTRYFTLAANQFGGDFISLGRVQTPTLKLIVDREREIENFDADNYWEIFADLCENTESDAFEAQYFYLNNEDNEAERLWDIDTAGNIKRDIESADTAIVENVSEQTRSDNPPIPFSTTEFIKAANAIGYDAKPAMSIAEDLYTDGHITYPRTDNTVYPDDLDPKSLLETLSDLTDFTDEANHILDKDTLSPTRGDEETTDHPPIYPTEDTPSKSALSDTEWEIYELVVRRFIATFADAAKWAHRRIDATAAGHSLKANGKSLISPGYHAVYPYYDNEETVVPDLDEGADLQITDVRADKKQTRPPNRYGHSKLIEKMESLGLGTKSTRHNTIDKLYDRDYIEGNPPEPTDLARNVISAAEEYAHPVVTPDMTSQLEDDMTAIADGGTSLESVTKESRSMLRDIFTALQGAEEDIAEQIQASIEQQEEDKEVIGECPECGNDLVPREANSGSQFVGCNGYPDCEYTLPLPNKGGVHLLDETCAEHGLHHVKMLAGSKTFTFGCPACEQQAAKDTDDRIIGECPECHDNNGGDLAIKRVQSGSRLVGCTQFPDCDYSLPLPRDGDIEITDEVCPEHDLPELIVHQEENNPWEIGCPICNYQDYKS